MSPLSVLQRAIPENITFQTQFQLQMQSFVLGTPIFRRSIFFSFFLNNILLYLWMILFSTQKANTREVKTRILQNNFCCLVFVSLARISKKWRHIPRRTTCLSTHDDILHSVEMVWKSRQISGCQFDIRYLARKNSSRTCFRFPSTSEFLPDHNVFGSVLISFSNQTGSFHNDWFVCFANKSSVWENDFRFVYSYSLIITFSDLCGNKRDPKKKEKKKKKPWTGNWLSKEVT